MTEPPTRTGRQQRRGLNLEVSQTRISALLGAEARGHVAMVLDGVVRAVLPTAGGRFDWLLPHDAFGRMLDVVSTETGASVLAGPVPFEPYRRIHWTGWRLEGRTVRGGFVIEGVAAPADPAPIAVELRTGDAIFGRGFAHAAADAYAFDIALTRLPPGHDGVAIRPQVGTVLLPHALHLPSTAFEHIGAVDAAEPWAARGWVERLDGGPVSVALWLDGRKVMTEAADRVRQDGRPGFVLPFPPSLRLDRPAMVDVRASMDAPICGPLPRPISVFSTDSTGFTPAAG